MIRGAIEELQYEKQFRKKFQPELDKTHDFGIQKGINMTLDHIINKDKCQDRENCEICTELDVIDADAFKRGVISGIKLKEKFPQYSFNLT